MNKDALLATFIGFVVGLFVTGLVLYGPGLLKNVPKFQLPSFPKFSFSLPQFKKSSVSPTPTTIETAKEHTISIESPIGDALEQTETVLVSGTTTPSAIVILSGVNDEIVVEANADGKYAGKVSLSEGKNIITATSFIKSEKTAIQTVSVFYTPEEW